MLQVAVKIFVWPKRQQYTLGFIPLVGQQVLLVDAVEFVYEDAKEITFLLFA